jgi:aminoglycoside/choline kinase family phosphotransferase
MSDIIGRIKKLFQKQIEDGIHTIDALAESGSNRQYFLIKTASKKFVACYGKNITENLLFIDIAKTAESKDLQVPKILAVEKSKEIYIQSYNGGEDLLGFAKYNDWDDITINLYQKSILLLIDFRNAIAVKTAKLKKINGVYNRIFVLHDLLYFKFYFLDYLKIDYNKGELMQAFESISKRFNSNYKTIIYRDFQARNILIQNQQPCFIDFQGAMAGPHVYDLVSLLWQAQAKMPEKVKQTLKTVYFQHYKKNIDATITEQAFEDEYKWCVLLRILQTLGAYGLKGLIENKSHFKNSIALALGNLKSIINDFDFGPNINTLFSHITKDHFIEVFQQKEKKTSALKISITSFSYKKGIPADNSNNGGGFVFDMRGILNPGRFEPYKKLSGLDKPVQLFLEEKTKIPEFIDHIKKTIAISIDNYIDRDFNDLMISFGCTGGQHRSVYAAEKIAAFIKNEYDIIADIKHMNKDNWVR